MNFPIKNRQDFYKYFNFKLIPPRIDLPILSKLNTQITKRSNPLSDLKVLIDDQGNRFCCWCSKFLKAPVHKNRKYCDEYCSQSAYWHCYPAKSKMPLLWKQDFKCNHCKFDYLPFVFKSLKETQRDPRGYIPINYDSNGIMKLDSILDHPQFTELLDQSKRIEVDHIIPVKLSGYTFGLSNVQILCYDCHKIKTKEDMIFIRSDKTS
jgi:5-methylcytosine-specific restriction endonuclease McrA